MEYVIAENHWNMIEKHMIEMTLNLEWISSI